MDSETSTGTEGPEMQSMIPAERAAEAAARRYRGPTLLVASVLLAAAGALRLMDGGGPTATDATNAVALAAGAVLQGRGCSNWLDIKLLEFNDVDIATCQAKCETTANCYQYNYQELACPNSKVPPKTCYLYEKGCIEEDSPCWDLHENPTIPLWQLDSSNAGCGNWDQIRIGGVLTAMNRGQCGVKCQQNSECRSFNFQPTHCTGDEMVEKGACYLFKASCQKGYNECWELFEKLAPQPGLFSTLQPAARGTTTITANDETIFEVGDTVSIQFQDTSVQTVGIVAMGTLTIDQPLLQDCFGGELIWVSSRAPPTPSPPQTAPTTEAEMSSTGFDTTTGPDLLDTTS